MKSPALLMIALALLTQLNAQSSTWGRGTKGEGTITEINLEITDFSAVRMDEKADIFLKQGNNYQVTAIGQRNIINLIDTEVIRGEWRIRFTETVGKYERLQVYITLPQLTRVQINGMGNVEGEGRFAGLDVLSLEVSGMGNINLDVDAAQIDSKISGMGDIQLKGKAGNLYGTISGSGDLKAHKLEAAEVNLLVSGMGDSEVSAQGSLSVKISGIGSVFYSGKPNFIEQKITGIGKMRSL